jgi:hypothetical protein
MNLVGSAEPGKDILPEGNYTIAGEPGTGSKGGLDYADTVGIISEDLFPTGSPVDILEISGLGKLGTAGLGQFSLTQGLLVLMALSNRIRSTKTRKFKV